jgi:hypothetical protein
MKLESKKVYKVDGVDYETKKEANLALSKKSLQEYLDKGIDEIIANSSEVVKLLRPFKK